MVGPKAYRLEAYFFLRVARFFAAFLVARFFVARFFTAFFTAFFALRRFTAFFTAFLAARRFTAFFTAFLAARFFAGLFFFVVRFFAVAISTSSKVGQDCRCTYRIVTSLHVSSGTAHELYITLYYLSEMFCNVGF